MAAVQGYNGSVTVNGFTLTAYRWTFDVRADTFDVTNFVYFGGGQYTTGLLDADVSIDCYWDTADDPFNAAVTNALPGVVAAVTLDFDTSDLLTPSGVDVSHATVDFGVLIVSARTDDSVRDVIRYSLAGKVSGYRPRGEARTALPSLGNV